MNTKDIVLVGVGVLAGHLLATYLRKKRENGQPTTSSAELIVDKVKVDSCNKSADDYMATVRPSAGTDLVALRKSKFDECMAGK